MRLRPRKRVTIECTNEPNRRTLLACHVREKGEDSPHICNICLSEMHATSEHVPNWARATCCGEVWHESCIHRYARESASTTNTFKCPQCKQEHDVDALNDWDASVVIDRVFPEDEYSPEDESSSSDASDASSSDTSEEESASSDDEDNSNDHPPKRSTRSNPGNHVEFRRVTRSKTSSV